MRRARFLSKIKNENSKASFLSNIKKMNNRKVISKKGFLLGNHTVNIIISVIVILLLVFAIGKFMYNKSVDKDVKEMRANMELIKGGVLEVYEKGNEKIIILQTEKGRCLKGYNEFESPPEEQLIKKSWLCVCEECGCSGKKVYCEGFDIDIYIPANSETRVLGGARMSGVVVRENAIEFEDSVIDLNLSIEEINKDWRVVIK